MNCCHMEFTKGLTESIFVLQIFGRRWGMESDPSQILYCYYIYVVLFQYVPARDDHIRPLYISLACAEFVPNLYL